MSEKDEHGGDVPVVSGNTTRVPAMGCNHCPAAFFSHEGHHAHMMEKHPDKPMAEAWESSPEHKVTYFPHFNRQTPNMYILSKGDKYISNLVTGHDGEILGVQTHPKMRRQGLATELLNAAHEHAETTPGVPTPKFSRTRTSAGDKFQKSAAKKFGGEAPTGGSLLSPRQMQGMLRFD
jgi:GNAT superfamily N-acetyltransferase